MLGLQNAIAAESDDGQHDARLISSTNPYDQVVFGGTPWEKIG